MGKTCVLVLHGYIRKEYCKEVLLMLQKLGVSFDYPDLSNIYNGKDIYINLELPDKEVEDILADMAIFQF